LLLYGEDENSFYSKHDTIDPATGEMRPMTLEDAQELFKNYFAGKPKIYDLIESSKELVKQQGYVEYPSGLKRNLSGVWSSDFSERNKALRQSLNAQIQGTSAHIAQKALILVDKFLRDSGIDAKLVLTVHDSLSLSTTKELAPAVISATEYIMTHLPLDYLTIPDENGDPLYVAMGVETEVGYTYGDEAEYDPELFASFKTTKGYSEYQKAKKRIYDMLDRKYITQEEKDAKMEELNSHLDEYKSIT
jgi:hypothetical protein